MLAQQGGRVRRNRQAQTLAQGATGGPVFGHQTSTLELGQYQGDGMIQADTGAPITPGGDVMPGSPQ